MFGPFSFEPPLDPSADQARQWAQHELAKAIYNTQPTLLDRFFAWLARVWASLTGGAGALGAYMVPLVVIGVVLLIVVAALLVGKPIIRRRKKSESALVGLESDLRTAAQIRAAAEEAAAAGDFNLAVIERFRALVRGLDERVILTDKAGRTAHEAATAGAEALPSVAEQLFSFADLFERVCYGHTKASSEDYAHAKAADEAVAGARRPQAVKEAAAS